MSLDEGSAFDAPYGQFTKVGFRSVLYDENGNWSTRDSQLFAPEAADYHICASLASFSEDFEIDLFVTRQGIGERREVPIAVSNHGIAQGCYTQYLSRGDKLDLRVHQASVPTMHFTPNLYWSWMTVHKTNARVSLNDASNFVAPGSQFTTIPYNAIVRLIIGEYNTTSHRYTPTDFSRGYRFCASAWASNPGLELDLFVKGVRERAFAVDKYGVAGGCRTVKLNLGDDVDVRVGADAGVDDYFYSGTLWNWLTIDDVEAYASLGDVQAFVVNSHQFTTVPYSTPLLSTSFYNPNTGEVSGLEGDIQYCAALASFGTDFELDLFINGIRENAIAFSHYGVATGCRTLRVRMTDNVAVKVHQESGVPMAIAPNGLWNWLSVHSH